MPTEIIYKNYFSSPLGWIEISGDEKSVHSVLFRDGEFTAGNNESVSELEKCRTQLAEFFSGTRKEFDLELNPAGTEFQKNVWTELLKIPYGKTISYSDLAMQMGDIKTVRAVGSANGKNPISIIVPCHRVIGMNHKLVGYGGGLWRKQWLLEHEEKYTKGILRLFDN